MYELLGFLIRKGNFCIIDEKKLTIMVSSLEGDLTNIVLKQGLLKINPLAAEGYFAVFMDVLEFVALKHKKDLEELENLDQKEDVGSDDSTEEEDLWL